ncbi:uncharacterized protein LOC132558990 [Ylistrum balloti]|uniref:uncharacterized protein LOC132558990 n=1 Tax=Ylistrum balloti TaxID=509963 RepID=UPI002905E608|nr:uncharacterized protein LOC132558990 [Ylistrum balloti]
MRILLIFAILVLSVHSKDEELPSLKELINDPELMKIIKRLGLTEDDLTRPDKNSAAAEKPESSASDERGDANLPKKPKPTSAPMTTNPEHVTDTVGNSCFYTSHEGTIIRSQESMKAGSHFLKSDRDTTRLGCIRSCCYTQGCTLAVFEDKDNHTCYLFNCGENNKCVYANHENYMSMTLKDSSVVHGGSLGQDNEGDLKGLGEVEKPQPSATPKPTPVPQKRPVPLFGECDLAQGDKCVDFNSECKQGICQCIGGFKAEQGVCYSVPVQSAAVTDPRNHLPDHQPQQPANPALPPTNFQNKLYQGQGPQGHQVQGQGYQAKQQVQSKIAQGQPMQGQGLQNPMGKQQVSSGFIGSPYQQGNTAVFNNLPIQQQTVQNPVYNTAIQANTGFLPKQQVLPQNAPIMNQQGSYWGPQPGSLVGPQPGSGFYDPSGYPRIPGDLGNRPSYSDDLGGAQSLPVRPIQGIDNPQRVLNPHRQYVLRDPTGGDRNYQNDRHYIAEAGPDNQFGLMDRQSSYRNHPYNSFSDERYDQYGGDVLPDNRFNDDQYYKDRNYQQNVGSHHKVFSNKENKDVQQKSTKPTTTTTTTTTTATTTTTTPSTTTTTTAKPTTTHKQTTTTTTTTPAPQNIPNTDQQFQQWGEHMTGSNRDSDYTDHQIDNHDRGNKMLQDNTDMKSPSQRGKGRVQSNISGKKFRPSGPINNGPIQGEATQSRSKINSPVMRPQQPGRPNRIHPNQRKQFRPIGYSQDGYPYYNTDYRGQHFQNYNWDPQYGGDYLTYDTNSYGDEPPAYDYDMFHKDFHRKESPETAPPINQAPVQEVSKEPVQIKTEKVTPTTYPKATQQPIMEKVDKVDKKPLTHDESKIEKIQPKLEENKTKTESKTAQKPTDKEEPVTSNSSKSSGDSVVTEKATAKPTKEERVEVQFGEEDGLVIVEAPTDNNQGPIVALALGLGVTMMLLIYVGCRLRNVKRRIRKGRALHSNEADYLINGMYL